MFDDSDLVKTKITMQSGIFKSFYGGKNGSGVHQQIINCIRPHDVYIEPFLGNGAVFRHKKEAEKNILNDLNKSIYEKWALKKLQNVEIYNRDAIEFLRSFDYNPKKRYCIYIDPPYPIKSRREKRERYDCEMSNQQHEELLKVLNSLPGNIDIIVSTYKNDIYSSFLGNWYLKTFNSQTRQYTAVEYLYMNYNPEDGDLHQYDYLGVDFTDRQRIKRKIKREVEKLKKLPIAERKAIIQAVLNL